MLKKTLLFFGISLSMSACEFSKGVVDKSTPSAEFAPIGGIDLKAVCIDGVQYWNYHSSLAPRYSKDTKEVVLCSKLDNQKSSQN